MGILFRNFALAVTPILFPGLPTVQLLTFSCVALLSGSMILFYQPWTAKVLNGLDAFTMMTLGCVSAWMLGIPDEEKPFDKDDIMNCCITFVAACFVLLFLMIVAMVLGEIFDLRHPLLVKYGAQFPRETGKSAVPGTERPRGEEGAEGAEGCTTYTKKIEK